MDRKTNQKSAFCAALLICVACSAPRYRLDDQELARFVAAGPVVPEFDEAQLLASISPSGPYLVSTGDILQIEATPAAFDESGEGTVVRRFRVDGEGHIHLPILGALQAAGMGLLELETALSDGLYPKYLTSRPAFVVEVSEYSTLPVTVLGAVSKPGRYDLRHDRLTLTDALTAAGGIASSGEYVLGARQVRVYSPGQDLAQHVTLPIRGLYVPYYELQLQGGERIEVERYEPSTFTVVGLVKTPGEKDFPPEESFNLMQALAAAGGVDLVADPPFATIFRQDPESGEILPGTFRIHGDGLVAASSLEIKPGDVIAVEHTRGSWTRSFMSKVFGIRFGAGFNSNLVD